MKILLPLLILLVIAAGPGVAEQTLAPVPGAIPAPDFVLPDTDGKMHRLSDYRGKTVIIKPNLVIAEDASTGITTDPGVVHALADLASLYMDSDRPADAVVVLQQLLARRPRDTGVMVRCGTCYRKLGLLESAASEFERAARMAPGSAEARYNLGRVYDLMGRFDDALDQHRTAIELAPDDAEPHYRLGVTFARKQEFEEAVQRTGSPDRRIAM